MHFIPGLIFIKMPKILKIPKETWFRTISTLSSNLQWTKIPLKNFLFPKKCLKINFSCFSDLSISILQHKRPTILSRLLTTHSCLLFWYKTGTFIIYLTWQLTTIKLKSFFSSNSKLLLMYFSLIRRDFVQKYHNALNVSWIMAANHFVISSIDKPKPNVIIMDDGKNIFNAMLLFVWKAYNVYEFK